MTEQKQPDKDIVAVILAGGKSSRMGTRKELLEWGDRPLIMHQVDAIRGAGLPCLIVCNQQEELPDELLAAYDVQIVADRESSCGPITGIVTAMQTRVEEALLIFSCDLPFLETSHVCEMIRHVPDLQDWDAVVAYTQDRLHPLFALYHRRSREVFEQALATKSYRVMTALERLKVLPLQEEWLAEGTATFNMNTPQEYETALREWRRKHALSQRDDQR
ncbi:molybdenum cofactor guanylyltransferase [Brevibacillus migulae]|uniref:molybdenum cofactor guanylyltransferase n=1 Tax=Brevibacillus migulae TaxID=1644114 RepID=UPI00142FBA7C|nr:molybdenum cofactor guanylyltransferase [Brevibacillus migulae]